MKSLQLVAAACLLVAAMLYSGCTDKAPTGPVTGLGGVTITKYVAVGNSLTAGYQSNGWFASAQAYSFPNLIAQQLRGAGANIGDFQQPLWADPGTPGPDGVHASRYEILNISDPKNPVIGPNPSEIAGAPSNTALTRPYDNLGIPGTVIASFLDTTNFLNNPLVPVVLRSSPVGPFPKSVFQQAVMLNPDFVTFWLGNNDVLGFAASGGVQPSSPTDAGVFQFLYNQALTTLHGSLPNAKILVANVPDVDVIPFFTTIGPKIAAKLPPGIYLRYQKHGNTSLSFDSTRFTEAKPPLVTLIATTYAPYIGAVGGQGGGKWYKDNNYPALPPGVDTTKPFGLHPQNPWPDALILDADEQATAENAIAAFNSSINTIAASVGAAVVDINGFLASIKAHGVVAGIQTYTADYISGGLFSLDGVHPSDRGEGFIANEFIRVMNSKWGTNLQYVDIASLPGIPAAVSKIAEGGYPVIPPDAFKSLEMLWGAGR